MSAPLPAGVLGVDRQGWLVVRTRFALRRSTALARAGGAGVVAWIGFSLRIAAKAGLVFVMLGIFLVAFPL